MKNSIKRIVSSFLIVLLITGISPLTGFLNLSVEATGSVSESTIASKLDDIYKNRAVAVWNKGSGIQCYQFAYGISLDIFGCGIGSQANYNKELDNSKNGSNLEKIGDTLTSPTDTQLTNLFKAAKPGDVVQYSRLRTDKKKPTKDPHVMTVFSVSDSSITFLHGWASGGSNGNRDKHVQKDTYYFNNLHTDWSFPSNCFIDKKGNGISGTGISLYRHKNSAYMNAYPMCDYTFVTNKDNLGIRDIPYDKDEAKHEVSEITAKGTKVHASKEYVNIYGNTWYYIDYLITNTGDSKFKTPGWTFHGHLKDKEQCKQSFSTGTQKNSKKEKVSNMPKAEVVSKDTYAYLPTEIPRKSGFTFLGWSTKENDTKAEKQPGDSYLVDGNITWYPVWKPTEVTMELSKYNLSFDLTGKTTDSSTINYTATGDLSAKNYTIEVIARNGSVATVSTVDGPNKSGFMWWDKVTGSVKIVAKNPGTTTVELTLKGDGKNVGRKSVYIEVTKNYTVKLYDANNAVFKTQTKKYGQDLQLNSSIPTKSNAYFIGWKYNGNADNMYGPGDLLKTNEDVSFYPEFVDREYTSWSVSSDQKTITFSGNGPMASYPIGNRPWESYKSTVTKVVIESGVTSIGAYAFKNFTALTEVQIANTVERLGSEAFSGCTNLYKINKPASLKYWGTKAFQNCKSLSDFSLPAAKSSKAVSSTEGITVGAYCFQGCTSLQSVSFAGQLDSLGAGAFSGCTSLESANISGNNTEIKDLTFKGCTSFDDVENVLTGITVVGDSAFSGCTAATFDEIPDSVTSIGDQAFSGCSSITEVTVSDSVTSVGKSVFSQCTSLESVNMPENDTITALGDGMFSGCTSLKEVNMPDNIVNLGSGTFSGCYALETIDIPDGLSTIEASTFDSCTSLRFEDGKLPEGIMSVDNFAFYGCSSLNLETMPSTLNTIGTCAFAYCDGLEELTFNSASVLSVGDRAFKGCTSLTTVNLEIDDLTIDSGAFSGCTSLKNCYLSEGAEISSDDVFASCSSDLSVRCYTSASATGVLQSSGISTDVVYPVTGLSLNKETAELRVPETLQLNAILTPANATNAKVTWFSESPDVATVSDTGLVTACGSGEAVITAVSEDGEFEATCVVTGIVPVENYELNSSSINIYTGETYELGCMFTPANPTDITLTYTSSNEAVATVTDWGEITALAPGEAVITARSNDGGIEKTCVVNIENYIEVTGISVSPSTLDMVVGDTSALAITVEPSNATSPYYDLYTDSDEGIIQINDDNTITALSPGSANVFAHILDFDAVCEITVSPKTYSAIWNVDGIETTQNYEAGATIHRPDDPVKEGYKFKGWMPDVPATMPAEDITFTAVFESIQPDVFTLTYDANGGKKPPASQTGNGNVTISSIVPTREGYNFLGWSEDIDATSAQYTAGQAFSLTENTILHAVWEKINMPVEPEKYTVTFVADGKVVKTVEYTVGDTSVAEPAVPAKEGYTGKWSNYTLGASNITVNAIYTRIDTPEPPANPTANVKLNVLSSATVDYKANVTVTATASGVPEGYALAIYEGNALREKGNNTSVSYKAGTMTANRTFTVKVIDANGNIQKDSNGNNLTSNCEVKVKSGFFDRLIAFFKGLFRLLPSVEIKP